MGLVGASAAASHHLTQGDHTYELIAYRKPENVGSKRHIDHASVLQMNKAFGNQMFSNVDQDRVLIAPNGADPVLFGIRGETPSVLISAKDSLVTEDYDEWIVYRTNQATDCHYRVKKIPQCRLGEAVDVTARVEVWPQTVQGGHTFLTIIEDGWRLNVAFFKQSGSMRDAASMLAPGDLVRISGGIGTQLPAVLKAEKLRVLELTRLFGPVPPKCNSCGHKTTSMGRNKGYRCPACKRRYPASVPAIMERPRRMVPGEYLPPLRYFRHLMKPPARYGKEKHRHLFTLKTFAYYR
ncbi:MAG: DUF1743 domain-containing protein [Candidatus Marsarchaeota archaeon]|nr:DUF1743 domain-containing protein [Candidatus Marsarchaeota archaeon]